MTKDHSTKGAVDLDFAVNVALIVVVAYFALRPAGPLGRRIFEFRDSLEEARLIRSHWDQLANSRLRLDVDGDSVLVIEFGDYECAFCRRSQSAISEFLEAYPDVGVAYRHLPLERIHPMARKAAVAATCAADQGRFREVHDRMLSLNELSEDIEWDRVAAGASITDISRFNACRISPIPNRKIDEDILLAGELGITGTPTFVFGDEFHIGQISASEIAEYLGLEWPREE